MSSVVSPAKHSHPLVLPTGVRARWLLPAVLAFPSPSAWAPPETPRVSSPVVFALSNHYFFGNNFPWSHSDQPEWFGETVPWAFAL